jgi:hypothetical protein
VILVVCVTWPKPANAGRAGCAGGSGETNPGWMALSYCVGLFLDDRITSAYGTELR